MTDTTIRQRRNWHKASTAILIAIVVLASLGGVASHFLKPKGYVEFAALSFGTEQMQTTLPKGAANDLPDLTKTPKQPKALAEADPLPQRSPVAPAQAH
jgi:hypothetical protein